MDEQNNLQFVCMQFINMYVVDYSLKSSTTVQSYLFIMTIILKNNCKPTAVDLSMLKCFLFFSPAQKYGT